MLRLNLQLFGGRGGGSGIGAGHNTGNAKVYNRGSAGGNGGGGGGTGSGSQSSPARITDDRDNVMNIVDGRKYDIYTVKDGNESKFNDNISANETRDYLEGYVYSSKTGTFVDKENRSRSYRVRLHKK